jgi:hypothetical protein
VLPNLYGLEILRLARSGGLTQDFACGLSLALTPAKRLNLPLVDRPIGIELVRYRVIELLIECQPIPH